MTFIYDEATELNIGEYYHNFLALAYLRNIRTHCVDRKFTFLASFAGRHRSSKSTTATYFGYLEDDTFWKYYESRVVSNPRQFMEAVDQIASLSSDPEHPKRSCVIVVDEAGNSMASSDYYENFMKTISKVTMMFGYLSLQVYYCGIMRSFVDSRIRKMFHTAFEVSRYSNDYSIVRPYTIKYSPFLKKEFFKHPIINFMGHRITLERLVIHKPPDFIIERYENLAGIRKPEMLSNYTQDIQRDEIKRTKEGIDIDSVVRTVVENYKNFEASNSTPERIKLMQTKVEFGCKVSSRLAKHIKEEAEKQLNLQLKKIEYKDILGEKPTIRKVDNVG